MSAYNASVNGLKEKNQQLIGSEKKLKETIAEFELGKSEYEKQVASLTEQLKSKVDDKTKDEFYNNELAKKQKAYDEAVGKLKDECENLKKYKIETLKTQAINKGIEGLKFGDDALRDGFVALVMSQHKFEPTEIDGQTVFLDSDKKQISDVLKEAALSEKGKSFIANGISGSGDKSTESPISVGKTKTDHVDIGRIMALYSNPSTKNMAIQMAQEAGLKVFH